MAKSKFSSLLKPGTLDHLRQAVKTSGSSYKEEEGVWKLTSDKAGNGAAVIRFLPALPPETVQFATYYRHAFKGPNGWYIENCRTSIDEQDPVVEYSSRLWATKDAALIAQARSQSRKQTFVSNILVVQDKANPANEGQVFLYKYGKKIFEKIEKAVSGDPDFPDDPTFDPFHVIEGANFRLRQKRVAGFPNYDDSTFEVSAPLFNGDEAAIMTLAEGLRGLVQFTAEDQFKPYAVLKQKLDRVMGFDTATYLTINDHAGDIPDAAPAPRGRTRSVVPPPVEDDDPVPTPSEARPWTPPTVEDDDDADLAKFDDD